MYSFLRYVVTIQSNESNKKNVKFSYPSFKYIGLYISNLYLSVCFYAKVFTGLVSRSLHRDDVGTNKKG